MKYVLENDTLKVTFRSLGGELQSIWHKKEALEYLWQGDSKYWGDRAPNLFPFVGRLYQGHYEFENKTYEMGIHGFFAGKEMTVNSPGCVDKQEDCFYIKGNRIIFALQSDEATKQEYPFDFQFRLIYTLQHSTLLIHYEVFNPSSKTLYFGLGGHPGFHVPLENNLAFEDYQLEFEGVYPIQQEILSEACFLTNKRQDFDLKNQTTLPLEHHLFDQDALVFSGMSPSVKLCSAKGKRGLRVFYPQMPYLGIWKRPHTQAPYICIEPWLSLPSTDGEITNLATKSDLYPLPAGEIYQNIWGIEFF